MTIVHSEMRLGQISGTGITKETQEERVASLF